MVFLCLFALPFAGIGLFALTTALHQMVTGTGDSSVWLLLILGLVFSGIGFGLLFVSIYGSKFLKRQQRAQAEHPAEPWLWREDWAQGRIKGTTRSGMISAWVFAAFWNLVSAPMIVFVPQQAAKKPAAYFGLIFPVIGVFLLVRAIRRTMAYLEFGKTYFEMTPVPGVIGGELKGLIQARFPHSPDRGVQLRLSCVHRLRTSSGNGQSASERILWRGEQNLSSAQLYPGPAGTSIPVSFRIPLEPPATNTQNSRDAIVWKLEALADVPGVDYHDIFEVPVFRTAQTPAQPPEEAVTAQTASAAARPDVFTIKIGQNTSGTEFFFPAARNKSFAGSATLFLAIFGLLTSFTVYAHVPILFQLLFGFFSLLMLYFTVQMWLGTTRVTIGNGVLRLQAGLLGGGKVLQVPFAEIASIGSKINGQQGGGTGTPYYDIELAQRNGRKITLGSTLSSKQEVDWLVEEMRRLTGLQPKTMNAGTS